MANYSTKYGTKEYPTDGVAGYSAIMRGLRLRIGKEEYERVGLGEMSARVWLRKHRDERPEFRRAYCELWAWEFTSAGDYHRACEFMQDEGYTGIYWCNDMWQLNEILL